MIGFVVAGIITKNKDVSIAVLVIIGTCWLVASICLTLATLDKQDK